MYLSWKEKTITDFSDEQINGLYRQGYVFTRLGHGTMQQTRSLRVNLSQFELSSENRRVLKKVEQLEMSIAPLPYPDYHWSIGKLGKDFYETKFGAGIFSAQKIKELLTDEKKSNFNRVLVYCHCEPSETISVTQKDCFVTTVPRNDNTVGYCIARETNELLHYCYPFYDLKTMNRELSNTGLGMMTKAIVWAKEQDKKYVYLGSAQRPSDTYKLQFAGAEWFDGVAWQTDADKLKAILTRV